MRWVWLWYVLGVEMRKGLLSACLLLGVLGV